MGGTVAPSVMEVINKILCRGARSNVSAGRYFKFSSGLGDMPRTNVFIKPETRDAAFRDKYRNAGSESHIWSIVWILEFRKSLFLPLGLI